MADETKQSFAREIRSVGEYLIKNADDIVGLKKVDDIKITVNMMCWPDDDIETSIQIEKSVSNHD